MVAPGSLRRREAVGEDDGGGAETAVPESGKKRSFAVGEKLPIAAARREEGGDEWWRWNEGSTAVLGHLFIGRGRARGGVECTKVRAVSGGVRGICDGEKGRGCPI